MNRTLFLCITTSLILGCSSENSFTGKSPRKGRIAPVQSGDVNGSTIDSATGYGGKTVDDGTGKNGTTIGDGTGKNPGTIGDGTGKNPGTIDDGTGMGPDTVGGNNSGVPLPTVKNDGDATVGTEVATNSCLNKQQKVLVLDFKSGWWEGAGVDFFQKVFAPLARDACTLEPVVEYYHVTKLTELLYKTDIDVASFTQVWILSGSFQDDSDLVPESKLLAELIGKLKASTANIFIGAGNGTFDHSNSFAKAIIGVDIFASGRKVRGDVGKVTKANAVTRTELSGLGKDLLTGIAAELPDHTEVGDKNPMGSDHIILDPSKYTLNSKCRMATDGPVQGLLPCIGRLAVGNRRIVIDSGIQRIYNLYDSSEKDLQRYVTNVVRALSK